MKKLRLLGNRGINKPVANEDEERSRREKIKEAIAQKMSAANRIFYQGFAVAIGSVARNGRPESAVDAMHSNGIALSDLMASGCSDFDLKPIKDEYKLQGRNNDGHKRNDLGRKE